MKYIVPLLTFTLFLGIATIDEGVGSDTLTVTVNPIEATIDFDPDTLNKKSRGKWVTVYIELPEDYDVKKIDGSTALLTTPESDEEIAAHIGKQYWAKAEANEFNIMDHDDDEILERMVKFDRTAVKELLDIGDEVTVTITGGVEYTNDNDDTNLADFKGQDTIRVIEPGKGPKFAFSVAKGSDNGKEKAVPVLVKNFDFSAPSAYPQPCNPETWIPYTLAKDVEVTITIYSSYGLHIRTLKLGYQKAGTHIQKSRAAHWDGRNEYGEKVSSGIYFYQIKAGNFIATKKLVVMR